MAKGLKCRKREEALTEKETKMLAVWIDPGVAWPEGLVLKEASKADESWWAYQPLSKPSHQSIDNYIENRLSDEGSADIDPTGKLGPNRFAANSGGSGSL